MESTNYDCQAVTRSGPIDAACDSFEEELRQGRQPAVEQFLAGWQEPERSKLLFELLRLEINYGCIRGEPRSHQAYLARFPDHREVVEEAFLCTVLIGQAAETLAVNSTLRPRGVLGQGGLGIVYIAEDRQLQRDAAVKFIQSTLGDNPQRREQFRLEAEITSRLEHPGVVPVYGMGQCADGRLFYAMRLIRGERLDESIAKFYQLSAVESRGALIRQVRFHELLNQFVVVCKTIAYAHNRGIVHRDIKPGNVMGGRYGETLVIDWGLAAPVGRKGIFKDSNEKTLMPGSGGGSSHSGGGTPPYMSPEQAAGKDELGPASDIYSLGATLYTIMTGGAPFTGSPSDVLEKVTRGEFRRPSQVNKGVSKALEAICLKAMSLDPRRRYATALELADDVDRYLADAPVSAYHESPARRLARWTRRHRTIAQSVAIGLLLSAAIGAVAAVWQGRQAHREKQLRGQAETAQHVEQELRRRGLQVSAEFAARTIASQIDIRWRILEREAANPKLHTLLEDVNAEPRRAELSVSPQQWLDDCVQREYAGVACRCWFVQSRDGTQVARSPSHDANGQPFKSLGENFAFRDYFHGRGRDYSPDDRLQLGPLSAPRNSTVNRSVNGGDLSVVLSVPIRASGEDPIGVLAMSIELGQFADLQIELPEGQAVLLVESRTYYMLGENLERDYERGEGLILHHEDLAKFLGQKPLPHLTDEIVYYMRGARSRWPNGNARSAEFENLLSDAYRDPLADDKDAHWLAAFAPVLISGRPDKQQDTGWFVIVQQRQREGEIVNRVN